MGPSPLRALPPHAFNRLPARLGLLSLRWLGELVFNVLHLHAELL